MSTEAEPTSVIDVSEIDSLIQLLKARGYTVVGPTVQDDTIVYDELAGSADLPIGWTDRHEAGTYRLQRRDDAALFGYNLGPHSWKQYLHPSKLRLWQARQDVDGVHITDDRSEPPKYAFLGVRACELSAIGIQDRVFIESAHPDRDYAERRAGALIIAMNCGQASATCFCTSMGTGPAVPDAGFDLALTELIDTDGHRFVVRSGSPIGEALLVQLEHRLATEDDVAGATRAVENARSQMGRTMKTEGLQSLLQNQPDHPRWDEIAERCLSCANCTMVCPTCFCSTVTDVSELDGSQVERWRRWDSCFTLDFTYVHGGSVRNSTKSRYRQWMTHKLAHWIDQFGSSGCVGCGRCITWCPVGIDITEEVQAIQESETTSSVSRPEAST